WLEVLDPFLAAGRGLAAAHEKDLVHRDFKPDNVMVGTGGHVRVMDFGLARLATDGGSGPVAVAAPPPNGAPAAPRPAIADVPVDADIDATGVVAPRSAGTIRPSPDVVQTLSVLQSRITQTGALLGTPAYMSPEQFRGHPADARSDQFSYCVALWEALYQGRPCAGRSMAELADNVTAGRRAAVPPTSRVPAWMEKVLARGLDPSPERRFPSMAALLAELDR